MFIYLSPFKLDLQIPVSVNQMLSFKHLHLYHLMHLTHPHPHTHRQSATPHQIAHLHIPNARFLSMLFMTCQLTQNARSAVEHERSAKRCCIRHLSTLHQEEGEIHTSWWWWLWCSSSVGRSVRSGAKSICSAQHAYILPTQRAQ